MGTSAIDWEAEYEKQQRGHAPVDWESEYDRQVGQQVKHGVTDVASFLRHPIAGMTGMVHKAIDDAKTAFSPVIGERPDDTAALSFKDRQDLRRQLSGRDVPVTTAENTPGAVTSEANRRALLNTATNAGMIVAPATGVLARTGINAAAGVLQNPDEPIRGAISNVLGGELVHGGIKGAGAVSRAIGTRVTSALDVSPGMVEAGVKDLPESLPDADLSGFRTAKADADALKAAQDRIAALEQEGANDPTRQAIRQFHEQVAKAQTAPNPEAGRNALRAAIADFWRQAGGTPDQPVLSDLAQRVKNKQAANEAALRDTFRARQAEQLGVRPEAIQEIGRRPASPVEIVTHPDDAVRVRPSQPERLSETASFGPPPRVGPTPVASSNGVLEIRPDIKRRVAQELKKLPEQVAGNAPPPPSSPSDQTFTHRFTGPMSRVRGVLHADARTEGGRLRPFESVTDEGLIREMLAMEPKIEDATRRAQYERVPTERGVDASPMRTVATVRPGGGVSEQAKAIQNLTDYHRILEAIDTELKRRGYSEESLTEKVQSIREMEQALDRERGAHQATLPDAIVPDDSPIATTTPTHDPHAPWEPGEQPEWAGAPAPEPDVLPDLIPRLTPEAAKLTLDKFTADPDGQLELANTIQRAAPQQTRATFAEMQAVASKVADELGIDPSQLDRVKMGKLSGPQIVGLKELVTRNLDLIETASRELHRGGLSDEAAQQYHAIIDGARTQNESLVTRISSESSARGRDLGFLRQVANRSLDPATWLVQAKRFLGDKPLTDEMHATVQRLVREAFDACGGA